MYLIRIIDASGAANSLSLARVLSERSPYHGKRALVLSWDLLSSRSAGAPAAITERNIDKHIVGVPFDRLADAEAFKDAALGYGIACSVQEITPAEYEIIVSEIGSLDRNALNAEFASAGVFLPSSHLVRWLLRDANELSKATAQVADSAQHYVALAGIAMLSGRWQDAVSECMKALDILGGDTSSRPPNAMRLTKLAFVRYLLGCAFEGDGLASQATAEWQAALLLCKEVESLGPARRDYEAIAAATRTKLAFPP
jgi:hypothetical protein